LLCFEDKAKQPAVAGFRTHGHPQWTTRLLVFWAIPFVSQLQPDLFPTKEEPCYGAFIFVRLALLNARCG
jgi:hypothetical protein